MTYNSENLSKELILFLTIYFGIVQDFDIILLKSLE